MSTEASNKKLHFFKDKNGRVVLWRSPNIPLYGWFAFKLLSLPLDASRLKSGFENLSTAFIFTWAFLEITQGVNYFRRLLGLIVMIAVLFGFFR